MNSRWMLGATMSCMMLSCGVAWGSTGTSFVYQGQLVKDGAPLTATVDLVFALYDAEAGGAQIGDTVSSPGVAVVDGLFTVDVDFGDAMPVDQRVWMVVAVRHPAGSGGYTTLSPRHPIRPAPYALALPNLKTQQNGYSPNILAGHASNTLSANVRGGSILGGGRLNFPNTVTDDFGVVAGGYDNHAGDGAGTASDADFASVGGGVGNHATGSWSTVSGGQGNTASGPRGAVGGGAENLAASGYATVAGGWNNEASGFTSVAGGGQDNVVSGVGATVGGGVGNTATAQHATVPGGYYNHAIGRGSFAAGTAASALHDGAFVWGDEQYGAFSSTANNQFLIRASGGVGIGTNMPGAPLTVVNDTEEDAAIVASGEETRGEVGHVDAGVRGTHVSTSNRGRLGSALAGVVGEAGSGSSGSGVLGTSTLGHGVSAISAQAAAVCGLSAGAEGVVGEGPAVGVAGEAIQSSGETMGVRGTADSPDGRGVYGEGGYVGVKGLGMGASGATYGVYGSTDQASGTGVFGGTLDGYGVAGRAYDTGIGVFGQSATGTGVSGQAEETGVYGTATATAGDTNGVRGHAASTMGTGVYGVATASSGLTRGVQGQVRSPDGVGVYGLTIAGGCGVSGLAPFGAGGVGVYGESLTQQGVYGVARAPTTPGVYGTGYSRGVKGEVAAAMADPSTLFIGTSGRVDGGSAENRGVNGRATGSEWYNIGVYGSAGDEGNVNIGVYGTSDQTWPARLAGYFDGDVYVSDTISKGGGSFKIDHPLDPANKYLYHSFVESPDMMNVYNGNVVTDGEGMATVTLPAWFEAVNKEFRYQLTVIGQFAQAIIAEEIKDNRFTIQTDKPEVKVSWLVTGIRQDPFAETHRIPVEQDKPEHERGRYLHPEARGLPKTLRVNYELSLDQSGRQARTVTE